MTSTRYTVTRIHVTSQHIAASESFYINVFPLTNQRLVACDLTFITHKRNFRKVTHRLIIAYGHWLLLEANFAKIRTVSSSHALGWAGRGADATIAFPSSLLYLWPLFTMSLFLPSRFFFSLAGICIDCFNLHGYGDRGRCIWKSEHVRPMSRKIIGLVLTYSASHFSFYSSQHCRYLGVYL